MLVQLELRCSCSYLFKGHASSHRIDDRLWLLEDLFLHEAVEGALHNLLKLELDFADVTLN